MQQAAAVARLIRPTPLDLQIIAVAKLFDRANDGYGSIGSGDVQDAITHGVNLVRMGVVLHIEEPTVD